MAGIIFISDGVSWSPASWVYDNLLRATASVLAVDAPELNQEVLEAQTQVNGGFLDMRPWSTTSKQVFHEAVMKAVATYLEAGARSFAEPEYYPGFMEQLQKLLSKLADTVPAPNCGSSAGEE
jgi:hypothetical protein